MNRTTRAITTIILSALFLAACARTGTGGGGTSSSSALPASSGSATASMPAASGEATASQRIDIGALAANPDSYEGQDVTVLARVDKVLVDGSAFLTSPSASEDGQFAVVIKPDAAVAKDPTEGSVLWVDGTLVGFTAEKLADAGIDITPEQLAGFNGEWVLIAKAIRDPLSSDG
jgi:hypothetical protein